MDDSFKTICDRLVSFYHQLKEFKKHNSETERTMIKRKSVHDNGIKLYNRFLSIYLNDYDDIKNEKKKKKKEMDEKYDPSNLFIKGYKKIRRKKMKKKVNHRRKKLLLKQ